MPFAPLVNARDEAPQLCSCWRKHTQASVGARAGAKLWCSQGGEEDDGDGAGLGECSFPPLCIHQWIPGAAAIAGSFLPFKQQQAPPFLS